MTVFKNCYHVLGVSDFADADAVKAAFRQLARQHHPDLNGGNPDAEEKFKEINGAYETLNDPGKRARHDRILQAMLGGVTAKNAKKTAGPPSQNRPSEKKVAEPHQKRAPDGETAASGPLSDFFEAFLRRGFAGTPPKEEKAKSDGPSKKEAEPKASSPDEGIFGPLWGSGSAERRDNKARRGEDIVMKTLISPLEAMEGVIKSVQVEHREMCRRCSGTGRVNGAACTACQGEKTLARLRKMDVRIPAGVKTDSRVRVAREGGRGSGGSENGDLFLHIEVAYDASLRIEGLNVYGEIALSVTEAVLGTEMEVSTLSGPVKMTIPPGTQPGRVFRLKERGVRNGSAIGDHLVTVTLVIPDKLSPRERELYQELARLRHKH